MARAVGDSHCFFSWPCVVTGHQWNVVGYLILTIGLLAGLYRVEVQVDTEIENLQKVVQDQGSKIATECRPEKP
jgi:hypothetical protein